LILVDNTGGSLMKTLTFLPLLFAGVLLASRPSMLPSQETEDPDLAAYREAWEKTIRPDEHHAALEVFVGTWTKSYRYLQNPSANEKTRVVRRMSLGGRFLWEEESDMPGQRTLGYQVIGYNKVAEQYERVQWHDQTTEIWKWTGSFNANKDELTFFGEFKDPVMGKRILTKLVTRIVGTGRIEKTLYEAWPVESDQEPAWSQSIEIAEVREPQDR
jgi:hypothetical protein